MLHSETVDTRTLDLIKKLMGDPLLSDFFVVGGTALSLQIGHRISIDIDLFCLKDFDSRSMSKHLDSQYAMTDAKMIRNGVFGFINDIKIDLIAHQYPLIKPLNEVEEIRMAGLEDIGAMKLHAIVQNGSRYKDFIDMYFLLERHPLKVFLEAYEKKYPDFNAGIAKKALLYFQDIDYTVPIKFFAQRRFPKTIEFRLKDAVANTSKLYKSFFQKQGHEKYKGRRGLS